MEKSRCRFLSVEELSDSKQEPVVIELSDESDDGAEKFTSSIVKKFKSMDKTIDIAANELVSINISEINADLTYKWKIHGRVSYRSELRQIRGRNGLTEIISFHIQDDTGEIGVVAFDLNAQTIQDQVVQGMCYEINGLTIRTSDEIYKNLPHKFQLQMTTTAKIKKIDELILRRESYEYVDLSEVNSLPMNSVIDIRAKIIRDFGLATGTTKEKSWVKREIHICQGKAQIRMTLWNRQAKDINNSMIGIGVRLKYVKVKWFDGRICLETMDNTRITTFEWEDERTTDHTDFFNRAH